MKKTLQLLIASFLFLTSVTGFAQRYMTEVFSSATVTSDITYANNFTIFPTGVPTAQDLKMDIYEPSGDALDMRPLIIYLHTGSFIPAVANQNPTGGKTDSTAVEMCMQFAKRGYVAASATYRQGWVPNDPDLDVRTGTLLQAVYRAIQDVKGCVRYFYESASTGNPYRVDTNTIIIGGQGTGGYVALAYATLDTISEIQLSKFLSNTNNATYGFQIGQPHVNTAVLGDFDGYGGLPSLNNSANHAGYSNKIHFVFNMGGALGDSSWLEQGDVPMICFHVTNDPYAPYGDGPVYVPTVPPQFVVDVSGSQTVVTKANALGNNACFQGIPLTDAYTLAANANNNGQDGLFPFLRPVPANAPGEAGPWEWYDSTSLVNYAMAIGLSASAGTLAYQNGLATNPDMSKSKALAYIDTVQNYLAPRLTACLPLNTGIEENNINSSVKIYPNPSSNATLNISSAKSKIMAVQITDLAGKQLLNKENINQSVYSPAISNYAKGIYIVKITTDKGIVTGKIIKE
jgi:acetyl esterase/lipase